MIKFNLQFFGEEKTEEATPKKKRDQRNKGNVVQSKDVGGALILLGVVFTITLTSGWITDHLMTVYNLCVNYIPITDSLYDHESLRTLAAQIMYHSVLILAPILGVALIAGVLASYMQVGYLFTLEVIKPKFDKISPISGFKRLFSLKSLVEMVKAIVKGTILVFIVLDYLNSRLETVAIVYELELLQFVALMWNYIVNIVIRCSIFLLVVAILDLAYKRWQHNKDLRMTKQEIKDEYKQTEGDPQVKGKIKEKQRSMALSRMMQDVPEADVVITNPTHYAVAIVYNIAEGGSPKVLAKGQNLIAQNIKKVATENDVMIVENKPLARALYASAEIGEFIPVDLYQAVAEVLAYVYSVKEKK